MGTIEEAKHALRLACGLSPMEPTDEQLRRIARDVKAFHDAGQSAGDAEIHVIVQSHCPSYRKYKYASINPSSLTDAIHSAMSALGIK